MQFLLSYRQFFPQGKELFFFRRNTTINAFFRQQKITPLLSFFSNALEPIPLKSFNRLFSSFEPIFDPICGAISTRVYSPRKLEPKLGEKF